MRQSRGARQITRDKPGAAGFESADTIGDELAVAFQERVQRQRARQVEWIVRVPFLSPIGRMYPGEFEAFAGELRGVAGVLALVQIAGIAVNAQLLAHVAARA